jgi:3-phosphoshikimate 1-carboxyvinyltransferase
VILKVSPGEPLRGEARLPGDKSISHRAALFGALADGESCFENFQVSGVTRAMVGGLEVLGVNIELEGTQLRVASNGLRGLARLAGLTAKNHPQEAPVIDCGNSATTMRLLAGGLSAAGVEAILDGSPGLRRRPMDRIVTPLRQMGVPIESSQGCAPLKLKPARFPLKAIEFTLPVASAQVKSCLLLAALAAEGESRLREPGPSRDHSERMLRKMGVSIESLTDDTSADCVYETRLMPTGGRLKPIQMTIPGDFSAAAFLIVAALITPGSEIRLRGVGLNPTRTGLLDVLRFMGGDIRVENQRESGGEPSGDLTIRHSRMQAAEVNGSLVVRMIDEFPALAIAAAYADGVTRVHEAEELRYKESDRISALCLELSKLGVDVEEFKDGFQIRGGKSLAGGEVDSHGDHRLAMALALAGLGSQAPVGVHNAEVIAESFPDFNRQLARLGANLSEE